MHITKLIHISNNNNNSNNKNPTLNVYSTVNAIAFWQQDNVTVIVVTYCIIIIINFTFVTAAGSVS